MNAVKKIATLGIMLSLIITAYTQSTLNSNPAFRVIVTDQQAQPVAGATVQLIQRDKLIKAAISNKEGVTAFIITDTGHYHFYISCTGYQSQTTEGMLILSASDSLKVILLPGTATLAEVSITNKKQLVQYSQGKTILNVDAAVTNVGTSVLEVLEKSPGVMVDRNGGISLQGKAGVLVLIDDKPTYLSGAGLNDLLSGMSSAQIESIELMTNPPAKYDASGNAGIINIKTKKNKTKGFNGTATIAAGQGIYPKNNNSLVLNYRTSRFNSFLTYSMNLNKNATSIYANRRYVDDYGLVTSVLDQPTYFRGRNLNNTLKTGIDYYLNPATTIGVVLGGTTSHRTGSNNATVSWLNAAGLQDSSVLTSSNTVNDFKNGSVNLNVRHKINEAQDIAVDADWLKYSFSSEQQFNNQLQTGGGYSESTRGKLPSTIQIFSGKFDHTLHLQKGLVLLSGFKSSHISTDNIASYQQLAGSSWQEDYGKSNHFIYKESIYAAYSNFETKYQAINLQAGLRYEYTHYNANQLGNVLQKDSSFSRNYGGLFPTATISWQADSSNSFTITAGRRIDRPAFQKLNPFVFIINKYTYQTGNPFLLPQYSTSVEMSHSWRNIITNTISFSHIKNYFSQLFPTDSVSGILFYSEGNVGKATILGLSSTLVVSPLKWWSFTLQATFNHKELKGINGNNLNTDINQLNLNCNNQFTFGKIYAAEISGFYTTRARNDIQELLYPTGQLSAGISRPVLKNKGTLKLSIRDILYTNAMEGLTQFTKATEYFIVRRDSRVLNLAFTWRFGKTFKATRKAAGSADEEMQRAGSGS